MFNIYLSMDFLLEITSLFSSIYHAKAFDITIATRFSMSEKTGTQYFYDTETLSSFGFLMEIIVFCTAFIVAAKMIDRRLEAS
ncbi:hypothetical protein [Jeotgalibacillus soli]|uniref:Uncharacterized protein n=1 Tax=Jeotgalibacillus soli TaxID=889306 RepID=A0A0C2V6C9_9BACL|nr:hypothetical protein [Jeotgalibacillus soli]KIL44512.1 hypothetical protein KP78_34760 [Jeotgalibacillus soli]